MLTRFDDLHSDLLGAGWEVLAKKIATLRRFYPAHLTLLLAVDNGGRVSLLLPLP